LVWLAFPRFTSRETGYWAGTSTKGVEMGLLWVLVVLLILFALIGGVTVNSWLFVLLLDTSKRSFELQRPATTGRWSDAGV
jgi:hypothetical protein